MGNKKHTPRNGTKESLRFGSCVSFVAYLVDIRKRSVSDCQSVEARNQGYWPRGRVRPNRVPTFMAITLLHDLVPSTERTTKQRTKTAGSVFK